MKKTARAAIPKAFWVALGLNFIWINASEVARYFGLVKPMLHEAFPEAGDIALVTPALFASWILWDTILIVAATSFFWICLSHFGATLENVLITSLGFTVTVFGLLWLGVANMGLAPISLLWAALPLAWLEQVIAAYIVSWAMRRG
ncbi:MAG: hypothetical protein AAFR51_07340 [Pseudomonadota bacterium]